MSLLSLLIALILCCFAIWAANALLTAFGIGDPIRTVIYVLIVLLVLLYALSLLGVGPSLSLR